MKKPACDSKRDVLELATLRLLINNHLSVTTALLMETIGCKTDLSPFFPL